jgi:hypothetical protein
MVHCLFSPFLFLPKSDPLPSCQNSVHLDAFSPVSCHQHPYSSRRPIVCCLSYLPSCLFPQRFDLSIVTLYQSLFTLLTGADQDVVNFTDRVRGSNIKGLPTFDPKRIVHASQTIEILKPLPPVSGPGWKLKKRLASIRENSSYHPMLSISCGALTDSYLTQSLESSSRPSSCSWIPTTRLMPASLCVYFSFLFQVARKRHTNPHLVCIL